MKQISLRLPDDMFTWLKQLATREHRSLQQQLVVELEARQEQATVAREQDESRAENTHAS